MSAWCSVPDFFEPFDHEFVFHTFSKHLNVFSLTGKSLAEDFFSSEGQMRSVNSHQPELKAPQLFSVFHALLF
jgi:hypothetical protein